MRASIDREHTVAVVGWRMTALLLGVVAEVWNLVNLASNDERLSEHFGYFTVQSNLLVLILLGWMLLRRERLRPRWFDGLRGAVTAYIVLTGIVYALLVAPPGEWASWQIAFTNGVQHRIIPAIMLLDWLIVPTATRLRWRHVWLWMLYPLGYLSCAWLRGAFGDHWLPYPFLDPAGQTIGGFAFGVAQVLLAFIAGIALIAWIGMRRHPRGAPRAS